MSETIETKTTKTCPRCETERQLDAFYKRSVSPDGRQAICKSCDLARSRDRDDTPMRVSVEIKDMVDAYAKDQGITQREAADRLLARALFTNEEDEA